MTAEIKKVMLVAGEQSGDILGAGLIRSIKQLYPQCEFIGIGGEKMKAEGLLSYYPIDRLSVMGFVEPLKRLPELLSIIKELKKRMKSEQPDIFVGIDSPDFNIRLEPAAKALGIYSVHYVSPSVWAWRQGRVKKIKKAVDLMLALLPFEAEFYKQHDVPVAFVGHPLADEIPIYSDCALAREKLGLTQDATIGALMPGSRHSEVSQLLPLFLEAAEKLKALFPKIEFVLPAANADRLAQIKEMSADKLSYIHVLDGQNHDAMAAADFVVMASGTTTLEAMLFKKPMVITYKWPKLTFKILKRMVKVKWVGLPNLLAGEEMVPELLQDEATADKLVAELVKFIEDGGVRKGVEEKFHELHQRLRRDASVSAANAIQLGWKAHHAASQV